MKIALFVFIEEASVDAIAEQVFLLGLMSQHASRTSWTQRRRGFWRTELPLPTDDHVVDVMEELVRFAVLTRPHAAQLVDRYSERAEAGMNALAEDHAAVAISGK